MIGLNLLTAILKRWNFGRNGLCFMRSIRSDQLRSRDGIRKMTIRREQMIPFAIAIPMSQPMLNRMKTRTMKPKKVVSEEARMVVMVLMRPCFSAATFSRPCSRCRSYAWSRKTA